MLRDEGRLPGLDEAGPSTSARRRANAESAAMRASEVVGGHGASARSLIPGAMGKHSVMIVDDVASCRKITSTQLGRLGYQIIEAGEGAEALRLYAEYHAAISGVLLDIMMPVMDGYDTVKEIRDMEEKQDLKRMPIIAVTSLSKEELNERSDSASFDGFMDKPTSMSKLQEIFTTMKIEPNVTTEELQALGKKDAKDAHMDPHGKKREHVSTPSSSDTSGAKGEGGSNEGSDDQNGRKDSNSDRDPDARSSGDSGNEQPPYARGKMSAQGHAGPDNSSKRPPSGRGGNSNDGSSDASRQGSADNGSGEEKSTMDARGEGDKTSAGENNLTNIRSGKTNDPSNKTAAADKKLKSPEAPSRDGTTAHDAAPTKKTEQELLHRPCARCGSEATRFCYYNNGLTTQPRHFCRACQRYWTAGGTLRNLPKGSGRRKDRPLVELSTKDDAPLAPSKGPHRHAPVVPIVASTTQNEMQRAILLLMTQVVGFDVDHAVNNAGLVASRAGEEVAAIVLEHLGHGSEAIEMAVTLAKSTGWRIGISISAVATAAVSQGLNQNEIASLIASQLPFLANSLVREVSEQVKTMQLTKSPSGDSNESGSGGSGGTAEGGEFAGNSSAKSNSTATGVQGVDVPASVASIQAVHAQMMQQWTNNLQAMGFGQTNASGSKTPLAGVISTGVRVPPTLRHAPATSASGPRMPMPSGSTQTHSSVNPSASTLPASTRSGSTSTNPLKFTPTSAFAPSAGVMHRTPAGSMGVFGAPFPGMAPQSMHQAHTPTISPSWLSTRFGVPMQHASSPGQPNVQSQESFMKMLEAMGIPRGSVARPPTDGK